MDPQNNDKVAELLGGLKRVNAPPDFESRVRARLSDSSVQSSRFGFLKLALPTAALAALGLFLFLSGYIGRELLPVVVSETNNSVPQARASQDPPSKLDPQKPQEFKAPELAVSQPSPAQPQPIDRSQKNSNRIRSYDSASDPQKDILPKGFDTNKQTIGNSNVEREMRRPTVAAANLLRYTGATAEFRGNAMIVTSIVKNSVAERVGIKAGDVIISLNEIRMGKATAFPSGVDLKTIRVKRNGIIVELKF